MSVSVRIPTILRSYTGGAAEVAAGAGTLREVIAGLDASYPGIGGRIVDDTGQLRRFVNVYVGDEDVRFAQGLDTPVPAGAHVSVIPAVAGGCAPRSAGGVGNSPPLARGRGNSLPPIRGVTRHECRRHGVWFFPVAVGWRDGKSGLPDA
jgi:molybdopterin synthase sulfur carrier subunit